MSNTATYPTLCVDLGLRLDELNEQQALDVRIGQMQDNSPIIVEDPRQLIYCDADLGFALPPTQYIWLSQLGGVVHSIRSSPQLRYLALPDAWQLEKEISRLIEGIPQWNQTSADNSLPDVAPNISDPKSKDELQFQQKNWACGQKTISTCIRRKVRTGSPKAAAMNADTDLFLLNIVIADSSLELRLLDEVTAKRLLVAADATAPIPVQSYLP